MKQGKESCGNYKLCVDIHCIHTQTVLDMLVPFALPVGWMLVALGPWEWGWDSPWRLGSGVRTTPLGRE